MLHRSHEEPPPEGGSRRVVEVPTPAPRAGRSLGQILVAGLALLAIVAALLWVIVPLAP